MASVVSIVFENNDALIVNKPSMWLSVPSRTGKQDPRPCLLVYLQTKNSNVLPVHRLDYEVEGLLLFAKSKKAQSLFQRWFEEKTIFKTYEALTHRNNLHLTTGQKFSWRSILLRGKKRAYEDASGKEALTDAQIMNCDDQHISWSLHPKTGRSHQLRYELFKFGVPIIGDVLYGSDQSWNNSNAIALKSCGLNFEACREYQNYNLPPRVQLPFTYWNQR